MKQSGIGREQGSIAVDEYQDCKTVYQEMSHESRGACICVHHRKELDISKPVVLLYEPIHEKAVEMLRQHAKVRMASNLEEDNLIQLVDDVEGIIIRANGKVSRRLMEAAPHLKVVARHGTGIEAIDRVASAEMEIAVVNTPAANVESFAEQCVG